MATRVEASEAQANLPEYLQRTAQQGDRLLLVERGRAMAALVSVDDLRRLETSEEHAASAAPQTVTDRQARYRQLMEAAGLVIGWPAGEPAELAERRAIAIKGPPLSEQILADRH